jgi:hypothetical protein
MHSEEIFLRKKYVWFLSWQNTSDQGGSINGLRLTTIPFQECFEVSTKERSGGQLIPSNLPFFEALRFVGRSKNQAASNLSKHFGLTTVFWCGG